MKIKYIILIIALVLVGYLAVKAFKGELIQTSLQGNPPNSAENAPPGSIHNLPVPRGVAAARTALAVRLGIPESKILILEAIETNWPDGCLGIKEKDTLCIQVITPGYNVLMQANGKEYRYRTNLSGSIVKSENSIPSPVLTPKETYVYHLTTCWGNPPSNYLELEQQEQIKINQLREKYNVVIIGCPKNLQ